MNRQEVLRAMVSYLKGSMPMIYENLKGFNMSVFQTLSLMIAFATLMILVDRKNDRK